MADAMDLTKFDDTFLGILQHLGKIEPFLDAIFFFLARRTDFFKLMHNRDDKMGFPPGVAEQIVLKIFKKYQSLVLRKDAKEKKTNSVVHPTRKTSPKKQPINTEQVDIVVPEAIETIEIETDKTSEDIENKAELKAQEEIENKNTEISNIEQNINNLHSSGSKANEQSDGEIPPKMTDPDSYNGAVTDKYSWSQTATDVDVKVPLPNFVRKSKDVSVVITQDHLKISLKNNPPPESGLDSNVLLEGKFTNRVKCEECLWSLVLGESIQINLEKSKDIYWTALLEGEREIDRTKLDTTRDISEFDDQTKADFQKVMYDHHQKIQGKPTSEEQKTQSLLKQAWDAEGSPFKGTPFDPSRVNISGGSG